MKLFGIAQSIACVRRPALLFFSVLCLSIGIAVHAESAESQPLDLDAVMDLSTSESTNDIDEKVVAEERSADLGTTLAELFGRAFKNYVGVEVDGLDQFSALSTLSQDLQTEPGEIKKRLVSPGRTSALMTGNCENDLVTSEAPSADALNLALCIAAPFVVPDPALRSDCKAEPYYKAVSLGKAQGLIADLNTASGQSYRLPTAVELLAMGPVLSQLTADTGAMFWSSVEAPDEGRWAVMASGESEKSPAIESLQVTERAYLIPVRPCVESDVIVRNPFAVAGLTSPLPTEEGIGFRRVEMLDDTGLFWDAALSRQLEAGLSLHVFKEEDIDGVTWLAVGEGVLAAEGWVRGDATKPWVEPLPNPFSVDGLQQALTVKNGVGLRRISTRAKAQLVLGVDQTSPFNSSADLYVFADREIDGVRWLAVGEQPNHAEGWVRLELTKAWPKSGGSADETFSLEQMNKPLVADNSGFMRRVLTRPEAQLKMPEGGSIPLDTFSILYVFADREIDGTRWLAVGESANNVDGWVQFESTEDWKSMLVMQYAPKSAERERTLFFKSKETLQSIIADQDGKKIAADIYADVALGGNADGRIVTVEPARAVRSDQLYLMPILEHEKTYFNFPDWRDVTLLQLAGITDQSSSRIDVKEGVNGVAESSDQGEALKDFVIRVAFVIDTTKSMGPYIEATKSFVRSVYLKLDELNATRNLQIALVGFRDNVEKAPDAGYVTRIYRGFDSAGTHQDIIAAIDAVEPAASSTHQWREDAYAGIHRAITDLDWASGDSGQPTGANIMIMITDASARDVGDKLASVPNFGAPTARSQLENRGIVLHTFHLETKDAREAGDGDIDRSIGQYREIDKLYSVRGDTPKAIEQSFSRIEDSLVYALGSYAKGEEVERSNSIYDQMRDVDIEPRNDVITEDNTEVASSRILSDIFRFQQEYLGYYEGTKPPTFYRAWVADRDFMDQRQSTMAVAVLITRSQLELLASSVETLLQDLDDKRATYSETYQVARGESGKASVDPHLPKATADMLAALPYYSKLLRETAEGFAGLGSSQDVLLNEVRAKLTAYRSILRSERKWIRVSEDAPVDDHLYPLPLDDLP